MALFGSKKKKTDAAAPAKSTTLSVARDLAHVLKHARITEKATDRQQAGVYVFDIATRATKRDVMQAIRQLYSVTPRKVAVVNIRRKKIRNARSGKSGVKGGGKKAYVYLKSGDSITIA